jgi:hypothetical protein
MYPAKYLGSEANALIANYLPLKLLSLKKIPVNAVVTGNFTNPKINTDIKNSSYKFN